CLRTLHRSVDGRVKPFHPWVVKKATLAFMGMFYENNWWLAYVCVELGYYARQLRVPFGEALCLLFAVKLLLRGKRVFRLIPRESPLPVSVPFIEVLMFAIKLFIDGL
ncbi:MAG: hypothetical protein ACRCWQ_11150, partial [Bacilli bacterium]